MTVLLIGYGYWGKNWAKTLAGLGQLAGVCDVCLNGPIPEYPDVPVFASLDDALASSTPFEGVVVATPAVTHRAVAEQALRAGKHVLVEKPMALTLDDAQAMVALAESMQRRLAVGHVLLSHPAVEALSDLVRSGELGEIRGIYCQRVNLGKLRNEENAWWSLAPHDVALVSSLLNNAPLTVTAAAGHCLLGRPGLEDTVTMALTSDSGVQASIQVSWLSPFKRHETVVIGSRQMAVLDDTQPLDKKLMRLPYRIETLPQSSNSLGAITKGEPVYVPITDTTMPLTRQAQRFIAAMSDPSMVLPNDGWHALRVTSVMADVDAQLNLNAANPQLSLV